jgi:membrane protease YdiL (CAAX protease family)
MRKDPIRLVTHLAVYIGLFIVLFIVSGNLAVWVLGGEKIVEARGWVILVAIGATLAAAASANWLSLRIFEGRNLPDSGLWWNRASWDNLMLGLVGGAGAAAAVLAPPLLFRAAHLVPTPKETPSFGSFVFVVLLLLAGVFGEELLFRGYGFQILLAATGPYATILPVAVVFAYMHGSNPNATWFGLVNTAGFGILFGYAYLRSRDLWLPVGLHFGWNVTLPLFGVNLSGLRMKLTGFEEAWTAGPVWSGGAYGPEASALTTGVIALLAIYLWKAPIRKQSSPISDPPVESAVCEPSRPLPS